MAYLEFTHRQCFETFVRCHVHAFAAFHGVSREVYYDNLAGGPFGSVAEHDGRLVRFHPRLLAFAREYNFVPRACNPASGWEKGKVERGGIGYVRQKLLALARVQRPARSQPPGAAVAGRGPTSASIPKPGRDPSIASDPLPCARCP